jgi:integrase
VGTVFKKTTTRPLPTGAVVVERKGKRLVQWKDKRNRTRTALHTIGEDGSDRIVTESATYFAKYRDGSGTVQTVATGCRDERAARQVLADLERRAELVRANVLTAAEAAVSDHQAAPLTDHIAAYIAHMTAAGCSTEHVANVNRQLRRIADECRFARLADLDRHTLETWLARQIEPRRSEAGDLEPGMAARTRNCYATAAIAFANWCAEPTVRRLLGNPFDGITKLNENVDLRRKRRAMTEDELTRLLDVARRRPVLEAATVRRGERKGERYANLRKETVERLERLGRERALIYKTLVLTGLRKGELASLTVGQLFLDAASPYAELEAADEKNGEGNSIPIRADLAADLRDWLAGKLAAIQGAARQAGEPIPARLPHTTKVFDVPDKLSKILNRDLKAAGIAKRDERNRVLDVHALRHTFGTLLSKGGVSPRTAQAAMRHSKIDLTMNVYTDPRLMDVAGALDALPTLPLTGTRAECERMTGTDARAVAPTVAPTRCNGGQTESTTGNLVKLREALSERAARAVSSMPVKAKDSLTAGVNESGRVGATGFEPVTPSVSS